MPPRMTEQQNGTIGERKSNGAHVDVGAGAKPAAAAVQEATDSRRSMKHETGVPTYIGFAVLAAISSLTMPVDFHPAKPTLLHVWFHGWITALSTGLGALPLMLTRRPSRAMLGISNAIACGMMVSASVSLVLEAFALEPELHHSFAEPSRIPGIFWGRSGSVALLPELSAAWRAVLGALAGLLFIVGTKRVLEGHDDLHVAGLAGLDARKALLLVVVMTLHSFSEGVGIGVSFGGGGGAQLGFLISATLAVHNVPEGLAVALALHPRGVSRCNTALWCVLTSLPQPIMAVPAFLFVEAFLPLLPVGLGFAAGAMFWVALVELLPEAVGDVSWSTALVAATLSFCGMLWAHGCLDSATSGV